MKRAYTNVGLPRRSLSRKISRSVSAPRRRAGPTLASQLLSQMRRLKPEVKFHDTGVDSGNGSGNSIIIPCCQIEQGVDETERVGNKVTATGLYVRAVLGSDMEPASNPQGYRVLILRDNQQVGDTVPTMADALSAPGAYPLTAPLSKATMGRFTLLHDQTLLTADMFPTNVISSVNDVPLIQTVYHYQKYVKLSHEIRFNGPLAADIQKGGVYVFILAAKLQNPTFDIPDGTAGQQVHYQVYARLSYTDS